jgi:hypothetical protein
MNAEWKRINDTEILLIVCLPFESSVPLSPDASFSEKVKAVAANPMLLLNLKKLYRKAIKQGFKKEFPRSSVIEVE